MNFDIGSRINKVERNLFEVDKNKAKETLCDFFSNSDSKDAKCLYLQ